MMRELEYMIFDVFTDKALAGNQLGVVLDADGLETAHMQAIAREFNLSETIFFQTPENSEHSAKVRIFMPNGELPFAGHPTVGGAVAFALKNGLGRQAKVILEEGIGPVECTVTAQGFDGHSAFTIPRLPQSMPFASTSNTVARALGIDGEQIGFGAHQLALWSAGVPYLMVPVKNMATLNDLTLDAQAWMEMDVAREGKIAAGYIYAVDHGHPAQTYRARMFAPWDGIPEDPATGSAAAAFSGAVWHAEGFNDAKHDIVIHQGVEMGRPSQINVRLEGASGMLSRVTISGQAVLVARGTLYLPE